MLTFVLYSIWAVGLVLFFADFGYSLGHGGAFLRGIAAGGFGATAYWCWRAEKQGVHGLWTKESTEGRER